MGRPTKPIERKRLAGNPGKRPLPAPIYALPAVQNTAPTAPKGLGKSGKRLWKRVWSLGRVWLSPLTDLDIITRLAQAHDEREMLREVLADEGWWQTTRDGLRISHPAVKELRSVDSMITRWESLCGFTPSDRSRLGMAEVQRVSKLQSFLGKSG